MAGRAAVERPDYGFCCDCHGMFRPVRVIDELLGMSECEGTRVARMARIRGAGGVSPLQAFRQSRVADDARPSAIANRLILAVPSGQRQPYFHTDIRIC